MKCFFCGGKMKPQKVSYTVNRKDYHLILNDIPALVCEQCGEQYFEKKEVELIEKLVKQIEKAIEEIKREESITTTDRG